MGELLVRHSLQKYSFFPIAIQVLVFIYLIFAVKSHVFGVRSKNIFIDVI